MNTIMSEIFNIESLYTAFGLTLLLITYTL